MKKLTVGKEGDIVNTEKWLKERGYTIAAVSSTKEEKTRSHSAHAGLLDKIDVVVSDFPADVGQPAAIAPCGRGMGYFRIGNV